TRETGRGRPVFGRRLDAWEDVPQQKLVFVPVNPGGRHRPPKRKEMIMKIIKRSGAEAVFDRRKIEAAVQGANNATREEARLTESQIMVIALNVEELCRQMNRAVGVEEIQDMVENQIMDQKAFDVARNYITYRYVQSLKRQSNTTDERILTLI